MNKSRYEQFYTRHTAFYRTHAWAKRALIICNHLFSALIAAAYIALCGATFFYLKKTEVGDFLRVLGVPALCVCTVTAVQYLVNRPRPYVATNIQPLIQKSATGRSFPSRHLASALVIAMAFAAYLPPWSIPVFAVSALLGYVRFAVGVHYPSDLLAGAVLGAALGALCFIG